MPVKHTIRADGFGKMETVVLGPAKAIRKFCRECYGFEVSWQKMVEECPSRLCPLYPFRFGKTPGYRMSDKQRAVITQISRKSTQESDAGGING